MRQGAKMVASKTRRKQGGRGGPHSPDRRTLAALDLGTNNCRLLVARPRGEQFDVIDAFSRSVRLGEGVEFSNELSVAAQERTIKALRICASKIQHHGVSDARIVATEACRRAINGPEFVQRVRAETGLDLSIISPEEEARLAVAGCAPLVDPEAEQLLVFDIGGGSTEVVWVDMSGTPPERRGDLIRSIAPSGSVETSAVRNAKARITDWISVPVGVSTLQERFDRIDDDAERFSMMAWHFEQMIAPFAPFDAPTREDMIENLQIIGVSGTATTFGSMHLGLTKYDRSRVDGLWLEAASAGIVADRILGMGRDERASHPGIGARRADLVISGAAILTTILRIWPVSRMRIADRGLREGMLYGLLGARRNLSRRRR